MKHTLRRLLKSSLDAAVEAAGRLTPDWPDAEATVARPAVAPQARPMPRNAEDLPLPFRGHFGETVSLPERHVYRLRHVYVSWHGVVFRNLKLFRPSIVHPRLVPEFVGAFLLRQWRRHSRQVMPAEPVALVHDQWSFNNYYHWMVDTLPRLLVLQRHFPGCQLLVPEPTPAYVRQTAAMFGFERLLPVSRGEVLQVPQLLLPELAAFPGYQDPELTRATREVVLKALGGSAQPGGRRIYVSRARQKLRRLVNEAALEPMLRQYGFETVFFEDLSFEQQVTLLQQTAVLVGVHGANLTNMLFLAPQATVVEIMNQDPEGINLCYYHLAASLDLRYYSVPARGLPGSFANDQDLEVEPAAVQRVLAGLFPN
jgi:hypothetical protein